MTKLLISPTVVLVLVVAVAVLLGVVVEGKDRYVPEKINTIELEHAAFTAIVPMTKGNGNSIAISTFSGLPFSKDYVYWVANYSASAGANLLQRLPNENVVWPNEPSYVSFSIFSSSIDPHGGLLVAGGFLPPTKTKGGIWYYPFVNSDRSAIAENKAPILITVKETEHNWFYHRVQVVDLDGDGHKDDLLTCRSYVPSGKADKTELVAMIKQGQEFVEHVIAEGVCDVFFDTVDLDNDGRFEILASGFFIKSLNVIYSNAPNNSFVSSNGQVKSRVIDDKGGAFFLVKAIDLDLAGDNQLELLASNHQGSHDTPKGSIYWYKLSSGDGVRTGEWERHIVYDNFPVLHGGFKQAAPGGAVAVVPRVNQTGLVRPHLLVGGDGSEQAYLFAPSQQQNSSLLEYTLTWSEKYPKQTVGFISVGDLSGDGMNEFLVPLYEEGKVAVYRFDVIGD